MAPVNEADTSFEALLNECGLEMKDGKAIRISVERREFQKRFQAHLTRNERTSAGVVGEIRKYFEKKSESFENALLTCDTSEDSESQVTLWPSRQNSLLCLLLGIPQIQADLLKTVLDILYERVLREENASVVIAGVIQALKWQDSISESGYLADRLFEIIEDFPTESQRQLIRALPDLLLDEESQTKASHKLCELYEARSELSGAVLEALGAIRVPEDQVADIRKSVLSSIPDLDISQLCPVLDFILQNLPDSDAPIVINLLRCSDAVGLAASQSREQSAMDESTGSSVDEDLHRFIEKIRVGVMTHKVIGERWLKMIEVNATGTALKYLDVLFLLTCYRQLSQRHVELTLRQVIKDECLTETLIREILTKFKSLLKRYISNVVAVCEVLLRSVVVSVHEFASTAYQQLFLNYDAHVQTDVIVSLLTHSGSGSPSELQNALNCVESLCLNHATATASYGFMLQSLVDQVPRLSLGQARTLFRSLSSLAYASQDSDSGLRDTLRIAARKRLVNPNLKYKCVGVVASVAIVEAMASKKSSSAEFATEAQSCLEQALESSRNFPVSAALFLDELGLAVPQLSDDVVKWIHGWASAEFQRSYVSPSPLNGESSSSTSMLSRSAVDSPGLTIDIEKLCLTRERPSAVGMPIDAMCPLFRLLRICEVACFGPDLQGINALLFAKTLPDGLEDLSFHAALDQECLLTTLFHTINWHRELLNCASREMSNELKGQLIKILKRQVKLIDIAASWLPQLPSFVPPRVGFEDDSNAQTIHVKTAVKTKNARGRKRKAAADDEDDVLPVKAAPTPVSTSAFRNFLRSMDIGFMLLVEENFPPRDLAFCLQELLLQLETSLALDEPQRTSFLPVAMKKETVVSRRPPIEVVHFVVELLPTLTVFIEDIAEKMKGYSDDPEDSVIEPDNVVCLRLCFSILNSLLSWRGFNEPKYSKTLRNALNLIASRVGNTQFRTQCDLVEFHKRVFNYFVELSPSINDLHTAAAFVRLLLTVLDKTASNADSNKQKLLGVAEDFLRKDWPRIGLENRVVSKCAQTLLTVYIEESEDRFKQLGFLVSEVFPELSENSRSTTFPLISKETIAPCFKTISSYLIKCTKQSCGSSSTSTLDAWLVVVQRLRQFLDVIKIAATNSNASCGLKTACETLDMFIKHGIPVLETHFRSRNDEVLRLVKTLQHSTRIMQHTCSHFKMSQQVALGRQVPIARKLLEIFIFKMKALFNKFGCGEALQMGQLKMRNLKGESMEMEQECDDLEQDGSASEVDEDEEDGEVAYNLTDESAEF